MIKRNKPPYAHRAWLSKAFEIFSKIKLTNINNKIIQNYNITSTGNESKIITALKFLGIIDENNKVNSQKYLALSYSGDKRKEELSKIIKESYKELFETIPNLEEIDFDILKNFFVSKYQYSSGIAESSTKAFVFFCKEAGIPLSEDIKKKADIQRKNRNLIKGNPKKEKIKLSNKRNKKISELHKSEAYAYLSFETQDTISLNFPINSIEEWDDAKNFIENKLKKRFNNPGPQVPKEEDSFLYNESDKAEST